MLEGVFSSEPAFLKVAGSRQCSSEFLAGSQHCWRESLAGSRNYWRESMAAVLINETALLEGVHVRICSLSIR
jgi:hypothetical protein